MGKKSGKGGKTSRRAKRDKTDSSSKRELIFKEDGQAYALIEKVLGGGRYNARSFPTFSINTKEAGTVRLAILRGSLRKLSIQPGDIVLLGLREWQESKADIIHQYSADEAWKLHSHGELPLSALRQSRDEDSDDNTAQDSNDGGDIIFGNDSEDDNDDNQSHIDIDAI
ncbi:hypothetical protein CHU98_g4111 [Xylaria longipes]|nr:hypothetical protein CHU98_g4111 [Xylaria longipes]